MWKIKSKSFGVIYTLSWASQVAPVVKNLPANTGDVRDTGLIPGLGRQYRWRMAVWIPVFLLENAMDRGAWWAKVHELDTTEATQHTQTLFEGLASIS